FTPACVCVSTSTRSARPSRTVCAISSVLPQPAGAITEHRSLLDNADASTIGPAFQPAQDVEERLPSSGRQLPRDHPAEALSQINALEPAALDGGSRNRGAVVVVGLPGNSPAGEVTRQAFLGAERRTYRIPNRFEAAVLVQRVEYRLDRNFGEVPEGARLRRTRVRPLVNGDAVGRKVGNLGGGQVHVGVTE